MKAKEFKLKAVNEVEEGKFELKDFKPYMSYESFVGCILGDAEILRPTGVKDINGIEIYEGYIVHYENMVLSTEEALDGIVVFKEGAWWIDNQNERRAVRLWGECSYLRIKGNIYENPELKERL